MKKIHRPYVHTTLNLGFMGWETSIWRENFEQKLFEYIKLRWYFFKWSGEFKLYKTREY